MRKRQRNQKGVTLMELLVYLGISSFIILTMSSFLINLTQARTIARNQLIAQQNGRVVLEKMTHFLRHAYDVQVVSNEEIIIKSYDYTDPANPIPVTTKFEKKESDLIYTDESGDSYSLTDSGAIIKEINFEKVSSSLQVSLTAEKNGREAALVSTISFRQQ